MESWKYSNPVTVEFGVGAFQQLAAQLAGQSWAVVTYPDALFEALVEDFASIAGAPQLSISDVAPNPDYAELAEQCARFRSVGKLDCIVAIGGGSVIDSAKVFAAAGGDFDVVRRFLESADDSAMTPSVPLYVVPTTAGTGSEVTCWATVWDSENGKKYSLARPDLYPLVACVDPALMVNKPLGLTVSTGLDAMSHALESIWNVNANPVSTGYAITAAKGVLEHLPRLANNLGDIGLRTELARAATFAGLAFSNTKTALSHNLSYPITLEQGVPHGIACSFTLPAVLQSVQASNPDTVSALKAIFGDDLQAGAERLGEFMQALSVSTRVVDYGVSGADWQRITDAAFAGERGKNFVGDRQSFDLAAKATGLVDGLPGV